MRCGSFGEFINYRVQTTHFTSSVVRWLQRNNGTKFENSKQLNCVVLLLFLSPLPPPSSTSLNYRTIKQEEEHNEQIVNNFSSELMMLRLSAQIFQVILCGFRISLTGRSNEVTRFFNQIVFWLWISRLTAWTNRRLDIKNEMEWNKIRVQCARHWICIQFPTQFLTGLQFVIRHKWCVVWFSDERLPPQKQIAIFILHSH